MFRDKYGDIRWDNMIFIGTALIMVWVAVYAIKIFDTEAKCAELGWANSKVTWNLQSYCIREENEYEITTPLRSEQPDSAVLLHHTASERDALVLVGDADRGVVGYA